MSRAFIGVGSNIAPEESITKALRRLAQSVRLVAISTFYREPAIDRPEQPEFYNGVVAIETDLSPVKLKWEVLRRIESAVGRRRTADQNGPRTIDLDLLLYDDCILSSSDLVLPHPEILERAFVAVPLAEITPDLVLPGSSLPIREIAEALGKEEMQPLDEYTRRLRSQLLGVL